MGKVIIIKITVAQIGQAKSILWTKYDFQYENNSFFWEQVKIVIWASCDVFCYEFEDYYSWMNEKKEEQCTTCKRKMSI